MPEECGPCKIIINGRLMATNGALLAEVLGSNHGLFKPARVLALANRAMVQAYDEAVEEGIVKLPPRPWGWKGCAQATQLMEWVTLVSNGGTIPRGAADLMGTWTHEANKRTSVLVSGRNPE